MKNSKFKIESYFAQKITHSEMQTIQGGDGENLGDPPPIGGGPTSTGGTGSGTVPGGLTTTTNMLPTTTTPLSVFVPPTITKTTTNPNT